MDVDSLVDDRYRLLRLLGGHGCTRVWCARDERLGRLVAVRLPERIDDAVPHAVVRQKFSDAAALADALDSHRSGRLRHRLVSPEPTEAPLRADMRRAREVMATGVVTVSEDTPVRELAAILATSPFAAVPVVDSTGHVTGLVTASDLVRAQG